MAKELKNQALIDWQRDVVQTEFLPSEPFLTELNWPWGCEYFQLMRKDSAPSRDQFLTLRSDCKTSLTPLGWRERLCGARAEIELGHLDQGLAEYASLQGDFAKCKKANPDDYHQWQPRASLSYANALIVAGRMDAAYKLFFRNFTSMAAQIDWAWAIATWPSDKPRPKHFRIVSSSRMAVSHAERARKALSRTPTRCFLSLAAAHASHGNFELARRYLDEAATNRDYSQLIGEISEALSEKRPFQLRARPEDLTNGSESRQHGVVEQRFDREKQIELAKESLAPLRDDPHAVAAVLQGCNLSSTTISAIQQAVQIGPNESADSILSRRVQSLLEQHDWSLRRLGRETDLALGTIQNIVNQSSSPTIDTVCRVAKVFGMSPRRLLFPDLFPNDQPVDEAEALSQLAARLNEILPPAVRHQYEGILKAERAPRLRTLEKLATLAGQSLSSLLP
jgi:transcriptional regulator with XRE-family HTH domain